MALILLIPITFLFITGVLLWATYEVWVFSRVYEAPPSVASVAEPKPSIFR